MDPVRCPKCPSGTGIKAVKFVSRAEVIQHLKLQHKLEFYYCDVCQDEFENEEIHQNFHASFPHRCKYCPKAFKSCTGVLAHLEHEHAAKLGLHSRIPGVCLKIDELPCRGEDLMRRAEGIGLRPDIELLSKDFFVVGVTGGFPQVTIHAVTPRSMMRQDMISEKRWPSELRRDGSHIGHLCTASDFSYEEEAHQCSFDPLNWVYMDPNMNAYQLGSMERFIRTTLAEKWDEILIVTVVMYGTEERTASKLGKALVMTRDREHPKIMCFSFPNEPSPWSFFMRLITLTQFRKDFNLPRLFTNSPQLEECGQVPVFSCEWLRCTSVFLTAAARDTHQLTCSIRNDPKAKKRIVKSKRTPLPCLHCTMNCDTKVDLETHVRTNHMKRNASTTAPSTFSRNETSEQPKLKFDHESQKKIANEVALDGKAKIIKLIEETQLSREDIEELVEVLVHKTPTDAMD